jgi:hypothetical protein
MLCWVQEIAHFYVTFIDGNIRSVRQHHLEDKIRQFEFIPIPGADIAPKHIYCEHVVNTNDERDSVMEPCRVVKELLRSWTDQRSYICEDSDKTYLLHVMVTFLPGCVWSAGDTLFGQRVRAAAGLRKHSWKHS